MEARKKKIAILGSTGSIGRQTLDVLADHHDLFSPCLLVANRNVELLAAQAAKFRPRRVIIGDEAFYDELKRRLDGSGVEVLAGAKAIAEAVTEPEIDTVVTAMVGYSGLEPTINAIKAHKDIALANKETLVVAGELITALVEEHGVHLYPIDSEHGAIYQCLVGEEPTSVSRLLLTASGGPFRTRSKEEGFEVIEAKWLFGVDADRIEVVVHPQSIIHSMVEFIDGSVKAQLGLPDMHLPIRYALGLPSKRLPSHDRRLSVADYATLTFEQPDMDKFPMLPMAFDAIRRGGNVPCVLNAANEVAVAAFLDDKIGFMDIPAIVQQVVASSPVIQHPTYDDYVATNHEARCRATELIYK